MWQREVEQCLQWVTQNCPVIQRRLVKFARLGEALGSLFGEVPKVAPFACRVKHDLSVIREVELFTG